MRNVFKLVTACIAVTALSACGSNSYVREASTSGLTSTTGVTTPPVIGTGNYLGLPAAQEQTITITGATGALPNKSITGPNGQPLSTSHTLRIKVKPLPAQNLQIAGYTNYVFPYGCLQFNVTVNGATRTTQALRVAGTNPSAQCAQNPDHEVLDFSNVMTGFGPVSVTISNAVYDQCRNPFNPFLYGCYLSAVWKNHLATASFTVQNDGTYMDDL